MTGYVLDIDAGTACLLHSLRCFGDSDDDEFPANATGNISTCGGIQIAALAPTSLTIKMA